MRTICLAFSLVILSTLGFAQNPVVSTSKVTEISYNSARIQASSVGTGTSERGICYSVSPNKEKAERYVKFGTGSFGGYSVKVEGLKPETNYYVRAYIVCDGVFCYGKELMFTTIAMPLPEVRTLSCSDIKKKSARVQGKVSGSEIIECGVCISDIENKAKEGIYHNIGSAGFGNYSITIKGLKPATSYYACFYAKNKAGTSYGRQISFTTAG